MINFNVRLTVRPLYICPTCPAVRSVSPLNVHSMGIRVSQFFIVKLYDNTCDLPVFILIV